MSNGPPDVSEGDPCPVRKCGRTLGDGHFVASGDGYHTFHTDKHHVARTWDHRDGLTVIPQTEQH